MPPLEPNSFARTLLYSLIDRVKFFTRGIGNGGLSSATSSSAPTALGYPESISPQDYINKYRRGGIAKSLVDLLPKAVWLDSFEVYDNEDPKITTPFEASFSTFSTRVKLTEKLRLAHIACRTNEFAVILIGDRVSDLASPLANLKSFDDVTYLTVYWQDCVDWKDVDLENDEKSPRFGRPNIYTLTTASNKDIKAHHSRVIHVTNPDKCSDLTSLPCLEACWNDLENLILNSGGGSLAAFRRADPGIHIALDPEYQWPEGEEEEYKTKWEKYHEGERKVITTNGVKELTLLASNVHNFGSNVDCIVDLLCGTSRTPRRQLIGNAKGQMGSETEQEDWFNQIEAETNGFAIPLVRETLDRILDVCPAEKKKIQKQDGGTKGTGSFAYQISFGKEKEANESELAKIVESLSRANVNQDKVGQPIIISSARLSEKLGEEPVEMVDSDDVEVKEKKEEKPEDANNPTDKSINSRRTILATSDQIAEYEAVAQVADRFLDDFEENWIAYVDLLRDKVGGISLRNKSTDEFISEVEEVISDLDSDLISNYYGDILGCMEDSGNAAAPYMVKLIENNPVQPTSTTSLIFGYVNSDNYNRTSSKALQRISVQFDLSNPLTIQWATTHAAELVTQLTTNTREGLREIITLAQTGEYTVQTLARDIKSQIGLRADQITAANNLANQLRSSEPGTVVRRFLPRPGVRDVAGFRAKVPAGGANEAWIKQQLDRYNKLQLSNRAKTISRTEVNRSSVEGQKQLWLQSQENGILPKTVLRGWAVTRDELLRDSHEDMAGKTTELDKPWIGGDGASREPGIEINCRCGQYLVFVKG